MTKYDDIWSICNLYVIPNMMIFIVPDYVHWFDFIFISITYCNFNKMIILTIIRKLYAIVKVDLRNLFHSLCCLFALLGKEATQTFTIAKCWWTELQFDFQLLILNIKDRGRIAGHMSTPRVRYIIIFKSVLSAHTEEAILENKAMMKKHTVRKIRTQRESHQLDIKGVSRFKRFSIDEVKVD